MTRFDVAFVLIWLLVIGGVLLSWIVAFRLHYQLRARNTALWRELGSPSLFLSRGKLRKFEKQGSRLPDPRLKQLLRAQTAVHIGIGLLILSGGDHGAASWLAQSSVASAGVGRRLTCACSGLASRSLRSLAARR
jgi:hypothetical protein